MDNQDINQKFVSFGSKKDYIDIIFKILENNGFIENWEIYFEKKQKNQPTFLDILYEIIKNLALNFIDEINFIKKIKEELKCSDSVAKNLLKDIKRELLPLVIIVNNEENVEEKNIPVNIDIEKPIQKASKINTDTVIPKKFTDLQKPISQIPKKSELKKTNDIYREKIE
jgi:ribosomal protein S8